MHQVGVYVYELILLDQGYIEITQNIIINGRGVIQYLLLTTQSCRGRKGGAVVYQPCTLM